MRQLLSWAAIGVANTGIHLIVVSALVEIGLWHPVPANGSAFVCANVFSFWANNRFTFQTPMNARRYLRFLLISLLGLCAALASSALAAAQAWHYLVGVVLTMLVLPLLTFAAHRWWTWGAASR
jgi:putative flippase GtrA